MSKYNIGVGEAFPLDESQPEKDNSACCGRRHRHDHHGHHHAHLAAVTVLVALAAHQGARMARRPEEH